MKKSKKLAAITAAALMTAGLLAGCSSTDSSSGESSDHGASYLEEIREEGVLVVGCDPTIEGICYLDPESGEVTGFIPEIINGFAEELGVTVEWETLEWSAMLTAVNSGRVDMIAANMNMTIERATQITFSDPYFVDYGKGCVTTDSQYESLDDLDGEAVKIGVTEGSAYEDLIPELFPSAETVTLAAGTWQDALATGIIDVAFDDGVVFAGPLNTNDNIRLLDGTGPAYLNGCAFAQGNYVIRDTFNLYLQRLKVGGDYAAIYEQYMGTEWVPETSISSY